MLTRDLLRYRSLSGYARPAFLDPNDRKICDLAAELLDTWKYGVGEYRKETENALNVISARWSDMKLPKGLSKVISDASVFSTDETESYEEDREKLFLVSSELLKSG